MASVGEFDSLDEELFAEPLKYVPLEYAPLEHTPLAPAPPPHPAPERPPLVFPEQNTVRLEERSPILATPDPYTGTLFSDDSYDRFRDRFNTESEDRDPIMAVALVGLLLLVLISIGTVMWWLE